MELLLLSCSRFLPREGACQGQPLHCPCGSDIGEKSLGPCVRKRHLFLLFRVGVGLTYLEDNLATFPKTLKVCLSFDLVSLLLGIYPKEIIG